MTIDAEERARLLPFYLATTYRAQTPAGPIDLRIGQRSPAMDRLLDSLGAREWAFISAANPRSQALSQAENAARHNAFRAVVERRGFRFFEGEGVPAQADWLPEPSLLVIGVALDEALELAASFGQNAIAWGERDTPPRLAWCDPDEDATDPSQ
ncbi:MAG: DUF3293 domain-containing protein [Rhodocyclaceae bacterium]